MNAEEAERRSMIEERRRKTYHGHALDSEPELGGRYSKVTTTHVTGSTPVGGVPRQPSGSPWAKDEMPDEPLIDGTGEGTRLGYRVDGGQEPVEPLRSAEVRPRFRRRA
jgi:hypothetical protein